MFPRIHFGPGRRKPIVIGLGIGALLAISQSLPGINVTLEQAKLIFRPADTTSLPTSTPSRTATFTKTPTLTRTSTVTRTPTATRTPSNTRTPMATRTSTRTYTPSKTPTITKTPTVTRTPSNTPIGLQSPTPVATFTPQPTPWGTRVYTMLAPGVNGVHLPGVGVVSRRDIVQFDPTSGQYSLVFRGDGAGLDSNYAIDGFQVISPTRVLLSFAWAQGSYSAGDIVACDGQLGQNTACALSLYLHGQDVGLDYNWTNENVDAFHALPDGRMLLSTRGNTSVPMLNGGLSWTGNDLVLFTPTQYGPLTGGSFSLYLDGSDVGLTDASETNLINFTIGTQNDIYASLATTATVQSLVVGPNVIIQLQPAQLGANSSGAWSFYDGGDLRSYSLDSTPVGDFDLGTTRWLYELPLTPFGMFNAAKDWAPLTGYADNVALAQGVGASFVRFTIYWSDVQSSAGGPLNYTTSADSHIADSEELGAKMFPTIMIGRGWMTGESPSPCPDPTNCWPMSKPPSDLSDTWDPFYGYSPNYYNFLYAYFSHYRNTFPYVAIENEAGFHDIGAWYLDGTYDQYLRVLKTAYKAIHDADPNVKVTDSGLPSYWWGFCIGRQYYLEGQPESVIGPIGMDYYADYRACCGDPGFTDSHTFYLAVAAGTEWPEIASHCDTYQLPYLAGLGDRVDSVNFHYYENPVALHYINDFLVHEMATTWNYTKPILSHETGRRGKKYAGAPNSPLHAQDVFRMLVLGRTLAQPVGYPVGLERLGWYSKDVEVVVANATINSAMALWNTDGTPRSASTSYNVVVQGIGNIYGFDHSTVSLDGNMTEYVFHNPADPAGENNLEFAWTTTDSSYVFVPPAGKVSAVVTDGLTEQQTTYLAPWLISVPATGIRVEWR